MKSGACSGIHCGSFNFLFLAKRGRVKKSAISASEKKSYLRNCKSGKCYE